MDAFETYSPWVKLAGFFLLVLVIYLIKRFMKWFLTFNYKHDKKSVKAGREFTKFKK